MRYEKAPVTFGGFFYPQELQEPFEQEEQLDEPEVPARGFSVPVEQKTENFFFTSFELH